MGARVKPGTVRFAWNQPSVALRCGMTDKPALRPKEGWHVLHLFYRIDYGQWQLLNSEEKVAAKTNLASLVQETRALPATQLLTFSMVSPKSDLGFMLLTDDLHAANAI
jgi:peroxiredoxin